MDKEKVKILKECEICKSNATYLCFKCHSYFCESCFKYIHDKQVNSNHKKETIDSFVPIELKCSKHDKHPMDYFCADSKGKDKYIYYY